jgi:hypothetical protein
MDEPPLDPRVLEYLDVLPALAGAAANLRLAVTHDLGPAQAEAIRLAVEEVDAALARFQLVDPAAFAAVVGDDQESVDRLRARMGLPPESQP